MLATSSAQNLPRVILVEDLHRPSATVNMVQINQVRAGPSWMDSITQFLKEDILPEEKIEADKIRKKATSYWLSEDSKLYRRSFSGPYLLCVHPDQTESLLEEIHERICGSHIGGRSLAHRPLLKVIGGQICRKKLWNTLKSVISASGTHQVYTKQGESSIHYLAHGHSLNGA